MADHYISFPCHSLPLSMALAMWLVSSLPVTGKTAAIFIAIFRAFSMISSGISLIFIAFERAWEGGYHFRKCSVGGKGLN